MKLATKIFLFFMLFFLARINNAQIDGTEIIINTKIATSKIYLNGNLLNDDKSNLTFSFDKNYIGLYAINSPVFVFAGNRLLNGKHFYFLDEYKSPFKNIILNKRIINDKDYNNIKFDFTKENEEKLFYDKTIFKLLLGSLVALGVTTAFFKIKADKRFKDYKRTKSQSLLDDTDRYDAISGVTFTMMQINFGVLVYYLLRD